MAIPDEAPAQTDPPKVTPTPTSTPLDLKTLEADLKRALAAQPGQVPPTRYKLGNASRTARTSRVPASAVELPQHAKPAAIAVDFTHALYIPPPEVTDILHYGTRDRAVHWLSRVLVRDDSCMVMQIEVYKYYQQCFAPHVPATEMLLPTDLLELLLKIFKGSMKDTIASKDTLSGKGKDGKEYVIRNVAWRGQPSPAQLGYDPREGGEQALFSLSFDKEELASKGLPAATVPTQNAAGTVSDRGWQPTIAPPAQVTAADFLALDDDHIPIRMMMTFADKCAGRKLAHLPEPTRTRYWLRMFYQRGTNVEMEEASMWLFYEQTFKPFYDTSPHLDDVQFVQRICKVFKGAEEVEVGPEHHVIWGIKPRLKRAKASVLLKRYAEEQTDRTVRRLEGMDNCNELDLRIEDDCVLNKFQELLLFNPILSLPAGEPSPWLQRLRRRARGEPLGDYQPGFPGVSMKRLASEYRRDYEDARQRATDTVMAATGEDTDAGAAVAQAVDGLMDRYPPPGPGPKRRLNADGEDHSVVSSGSERTTLAP
ncbi:hypothetical protein LTR85_001422 [Meristemomyces frigidus]|nr:hypothetical protein LTR85_001422 [Meristemomyces frigidus]